MGGGGGEKGYGGGERGRLYTYRYTVTTRMTCIKMGSDESHFNVSSIVTDKVTRPTTTFDEKGEPKRIRTEAPLLTSLTPYRWAKPALFRITHSEKPLYTLHPVSLKFPRCYVSNTSEVVPTDAGPFSSFQGRSSNSSSFYVSLIQAIDGVMSIASVLCTSDMMNLCFALIYDLQVAVG